MSTTALVNRNLIIELAILGIAARVVDAFASGHWIEEEGLGLSVGALPRNEKPKRREKWR
jgi:hypothetical protein